MGVVRVSSNQYVRKLYARWQARRPTGVEIAGSVGIFSVGDTIL